MVSAAPAPAPAAAAAGASRAGFSDGWLTEALRAAAEPAVGEKKKKARSRRCAFSRARRDLRLCLTYAMAEARREQRRGVGRSEGALQQTELVFFSHTIPRASIRFDEQKARKKAKKEAAAAAKAAAGAP